MLCVSLNGIFLLYFFLKKRFNLKRNNCDKYKGHFGPVLIHVVLVQNGILLTNIKCGDNLGQ